MAKVRKNVETQTPQGDFFEEEIVIPTEAPPSTSLYDLSEHYVYLQDSATGVVNHFSNSWPNAQRCSVGVFDSLQNQLATLLMLTLASRLMTLTYFIPERVKQLVNACFALYIFRIWCPNDVVFQASILMGIFTVIYTYYARYRQKGYLVTALAIAGMIALQWYLPAKVFTAHRGILMILAMKLSALAFDSQTYVHDVILSFTYLFNPATIIFGPFVSYREYVDSFRRKGGFWPEIENLWNAVYALFLAAIWVLTSSCADTVIPNATENQQYFNTAFSFRSSHYFISYLSEALVTIAGYNLVVARPLAVEFPRSIGALVTSWNVPMHDYLKKYIYKKFVSFGQFTAIIATFGVSSLLHGINAQFSLVLLTLGFNAYFESQLRDGLVRLFGNIDIGARSERYRKKNVLATGINFLFILLNIHQLIYLGMPFVNAGQDTGYHYEHTLKSWERMKYCGHVVIVAEAIGSLLLQAPTFIKKWRR